MPDSLGAACEGKLDDLFDPTDFDGSSPDAHATPEQLPWLDRAVAVAPRMGTPLFSDADRVEWNAAVAGLRATVAIYGTEWIHRGWDLCLHGAKVFANRWTPDDMVARLAFFERMRQSPPRPVVTKRLPEADPAILD